MKSLTRSRFNFAADLLPEIIRRDALALLENTENIEEIRLRAGRSPTALSFGREKIFSTVCIDEEIMQYIVERAAKYSLHTAAEAMRKGYIAAEGGIRVGITGTAATENGKVIGLRCINGICIRISHEIPGIAAPIVKNLGGAERMPSTLIISPPGAGKTTLLRDMVRIVSSNGLRVALCDERGEIAAMSGGIPQFDVGLFTDVMDGCTRTEAMEMMLRSMNPQVIAADEIASEQDVKAVLAAAGCGVRLIATAHAANTDELMRRTALRAIVESGVFDAVVTVQNVSGTRNYDIGGLRG